MVDDVCCASKVLRDEGYHISARRGKCKVWFRFNHGVTIKIDIHEDSVLVQSISVEETVERLNYGLPQLLIEMKFNALGITGRTQDNKVETDLSDIKWLAKWLLRKGKRLRTPVTQQQLQNWNEVLQEAKFSDLQDLLTELN